MADFAERERVQYPVFTEDQIGTQLFDVWNDYYEDVAGPMFPHSVSLPISGIPTEDGQAIFGRHFEVMEQLQREWTVAWRMFSVVRSRMQADDIDLEEAGETVLALPRTDFSDKQNEIARDGLVNRGLSVYADRSDYNFPEHFEASIDLSRYFRTLPDGTVELLQQHEADTMMEGWEIATSGLFVAVKRLYGPTHQAYNKDERGVEMIVSSHSLTTDEHDEYMPVIETYGKRDELELDLDDDAIIERLNGQRPRTSERGTEYL